MPIYVYEDLKTGEEFEEFQSINADPLTENPETGNPVRRVITAPKVRGDTSFFAGRKSMHDQFNGDPAYLRRIGKEYKKATGMTLPADAVYFSQLADKPFDPAAVVTTAEGKAGLDRLINRRLDKVKRKAEAPPIRLAEDIVQRKVKEARAMGDKTETAELRHRIIEKHGRKI